MRRRLLAIACVLGLIASHPSPDKTHTVPPPSGTVRMVVVGVPSGDTVDFLDGPTAKRRLPLAHIDAPELPHGCYARSAQAYLVSLLPPGLQVDVTVDGAGPAANVWRGDGLWVNGAVLSEGLAVRVPSDSPYDQEALHHERLARDSRAGLHSGGACPVADSPQGHSVVRVRHGRRPLPS